MCINQRCKNTQAKRLDTLTLGDEQRIRATIASMCLKIE
jgi:hypothetical protein